MSTVSLIKYYCLYQMDNVIRNCAVKLMGSYIWTHSIVETFIILGMSSLCNI